MEAQCFTTGPPGKSGDNPFLVLSISYSFDLLSLKFSVSYSKFLRPQIIIFLKIMHPISAVISVYTTFLEPQNTLWRNRNPVSVTKYFKWLENYAFIADLNLGQVQRELKKVTRLEVILLKTELVLSRIKLSILRFFVNQSSKDSLLSQKRNKQAEQTVKRFRSSATEIAACHAARSVNLNLDCSLLWNQDIPFLFKKEWSRSQFSCF